MKNILNTLISPFGLIYSLVIKHLAFRICKKDFQEKEYKIQSLYKKIRNLHQKNENLAKELKLERDKQQRIKNFIQYWENKEKKVFLSNKNELIFVFMNIDEKLNDWIYLCGENGKHQSNDSRIALFFSEDKLKISDFISNTQRQGYGRILLEYVINLARENGIKKVVGDLAPNDKDKFVWLIPFYESIGFKKELFDETSEEKMNGKIWLFL